MTKETVVAPPAVTHETVIERPVVTQESIVAAPGAACNLGSTAYSSGYLSCQTGYEYRCGADGIWHRTGNAC